MIIIKRIIDFLVVPFILLGMFIAIIFSSIMTGWVVALNFYEELVKREAEEEE